MSMTNTESIISHIANSEISEACALFSSSYSKDPKSFVSSLKKHGAFRSSHYEFRTSPIRGLIIRIQSDVPGMRLEDVKYFDSLINLLHYGFSVESIFKQFRRGLSGRSLKEHLALVEFLFWKGHHPSSHDSRVSFEDFSIEDLLEAFSTYFFYLIKKVKPSQISFSALDLKSFYSGAAAKNIEDLCKLHAYKEAEVLVDNFGYHVGRSKSTYTMHSPDKLEQFIRMGYMRQEMQTMASRYREEKNSVGEEVSNLGVQLYTALKEKVAYIKTSPERIVINLPPTPELVAMINSNALYKDEQIEIALWAKDLSINFEQFRDTVVFEGLTCLDFIKFQRLFKVAGAIFNEKIKAMQSGAEYSGIAIQSLLPVLPKVQFMELLEVFFGHSRARALYNIFSHKMDDKSTFDIQYSPLLLCGDRVVYPVWIISNSNLVRNALQKCGFRFDKKSETDPLGDMLESAFGEKGIGVWKNVRYKWNGNEGDIDFAVLFDNVLFVFECKNSLLPCTVYELRTSYDYTKKAANQLTRFSALMKEESFRVYISRKIGVKSSKIKCRIVTCIVMGNRMFAGMRIDSQAIRPIHELCGFIYDGKIMMQWPYDAEKSVEYTTWIGDTLSARDLVDYIEGDLMYESLFASMVPVDQITKLRGKSMILKSFRLDLQMLAEKIEEKFQKSE